MGLREAYLPATGFDHEFPGQVRSRLWLQGADDNALVKRITRYNLKGQVVSDGLGLFSRMLEISLGAWKGTGQRGLALNRWEATLTSLHHLLTCQWWKTDKEKACPWV